MQLLIREPMEHPLVGVLERLQASQPPPGKEAHRWLDEHVECVAVLLKLRGGKLAADLLGVEQLNMTEWIRARRGLLAALGFEVVR